MNIAFLLATLHSPFYPDTREITTYVTVAEDGLIEASLGTELSLLGQNGQHVSWRVGINGGIFTGFHNVGGMVFPMETVDGIFGIPVDIHIDNLQLRTTLGHTSAHTADGAEPTAAYSREWIQQQVGVDNNGLRPYVGARWTYHTVEEGGGLSLQVGLTVDSDEDVGPYFGIDLKAAEESEWSPTFVTHLGLQIPGERTALRIGMINYTGNQDAGAWYGQKEQYIGLTVGLDTLP